MSLFEHGWKHDKGQCIISRAYAECLIFQKSEEEYMDKFIMVK